MCMTADQLKDLMTVNEETEDEKQEQEYIPLKEHKYVIVSTVAYLIGVKEDHFAEEGKIFKSDIFKKLNINKNARIIRNLCILRTNIERRYKQIVIDQQTGVNGSVLSMSKYVSQDAVLSLSSDGIRIPQKAGMKPVDYVVEINRLIQDRINNCKTIFPTWINFAYIKDLFIMPDGITKAGAAQAARDYYGNLSYYPYGIYVNIPPADNGNILMNDRKFTALIYEWNNDEFEDISKVHDVSSFVKGNIYQFIDKGSKIDMIVDCENSDVYNIISMLRSLKWEESLEKISKIILINDVHTNLGWQELEKYTDIPVEHIMTERVKSEKSLVDFTLIAKAYEEFYENSVDSFILLSSDSDYWSLIKYLKKANFLVMVEHLKCGPDLKQILEDNMIFYCYLDDFYSGEESDKMKNSMILKMIANDLTGRRFNIKDVFDSAAYNLRIEMDDCQRKQFFAKYLKNLQLCIDDDGSISLKLKDKCA